jgi:hypothetical protein
MTDISRVVRVSNAGVGSVKYVEFRNLLKLGISLDDKDFRASSSNEIPSFSKFLNSTY